MRTRSWLFGVVLSALAVTALNTGCRRNESSSTEGSKTRTSRTGSEARPLTHRKFERTQQRLARGRYLYQSVMACDYCHAPYNPKSPGWPPLARKSGAGLEYSARYVPDIVAPNITPDRETGAGTWTDDMLARAIREGVGHDGRTLDPNMPYAWYNVLSDEDLASLIVYVRSLPPVRNALPRMATPDQFKKYVHPVPITEPRLPPDFSVPAKRGKYLVRLAHCNDCHTPGPSAYYLVHGLEFAGGTQAQAPGESAACANITPDPSGISYYDEAQFLKALRTGKVGARKLSPIMPWWFFGHMTDDDLKAIFAYLRTLKPVHHRVDNTEPIAYCKICGQKHAGGALNY
jgi:mono/diheme cytochrome c family protein